MSGIALDEISSNLQEFQGDTKLSNKFFGVKNRDFRFFQFWKIIILLYDFATKFSSHLDFAPRRYSGRLWSGLDFPGGTAAREVANG